VRELREKAGLNFKELSDRLAAAGRSIPPLGLRRIEAEDRRVDADDLVALAVALRVNPSALLLPPTVEVEIEVTGGGVVTGKRAWDWVDGVAGPLHEVSDDGSAALEFQLRARPSDRRRFGAGTPAGLAAIKAQFEEWGLRVVENEDGAGFGVRSAEEGS